MARFTRPETPERGCKIGVQLLSASGRIALACHWNISFLTEDGFYAGNIGIDCFLKARMPSLIHFRK